MIQLSFDKKYPSKTIFCDCDAPHININKNYACKNCDICINLKDRFINKIKIYSHNGSFRIKKNSITYMEENNVVFNYIQQAIGGIYIQRNFNINKSFEDMTLRQLKEKLNNMMLLR